LLCLTEINSAIGQLKAAVPARLLSPATCFTKAGAPRTFMGPISPGFSRSLQPRRQSGWGRRIARGSAHLVAGAEWRRTTNPDLG